MFWIAATFLVMIVMLSVYVPLGRSAKADTTKPALMRALAAELSEINAATRFANVEEANAARAEIGRRLLALEAAPEKPQSARRTSPLFALFALVPILAVPLYVQLGQPEYADQNFATRMDANPEAGQEEVATLIERVETRLREKPSISAWPVSMTV
jgi:cytochrome c-type biogenesis protein CcmH